VDSLLAESDSLRLFVNDHWNGMNTNHHQCGNQPGIRGILRRQRLECAADFGGRADLADLVLEFFHVTKSHDIERNGKKSNRGWRKVRLRAPSTFQLVDPPSSDGYGEARGAE